METSIQNERITYLDSLRGIAAMMVVFYHFFGWKWEQTLRFKLSSLIFNGSDAVSFFFVLSGLVLSYKYFHHNKKINFPLFVYKRVLRLYPAFIFTVLVNYLYWNRENLNWELLNDIFYANKNKLWEELTMVQRAHMYYVPGWTLRVEMILSLVVPLFVIMAKKQIKLVIWFLPLSILMSFYISTFTFHFLLGVVIAYYFPVIKTYDFSKHKLYPWRYLLGLIVLILFSLRHIDRISALGPTLKYVLEVINFDMFHFTGFAAFCIIVWVINNKKVQTFLDHPILLFLGKISYGVYLMHWVFVKYAMNFWKEWTYVNVNPVVAFTILLLAVLTATILSATFVHYYIEMFFIKISRRKKKKVA